LNLSTEQISKMNDDFNSDERLLSLLRQRFLRLQIQPMRKRDRADLDSEMNNLVRVIKEVEKDRDNEILTELSEEQHRLWNSLCGAPISIDWKTDYFTDLPFQYGITNGTQ